MFSLGGIMKNILIAILLCIAVTAGDTERSAHDAEAWENYKMKNKKQYDSDEEERNHKKVYSIHRERIRSHNARYECGCESYDVRENPYTDILNLDFDKTQNGFSGTRQEVDSSDETFRPRDVTELPREVDWRRAGAVTPVRNQGSCRSCWAFSSIGALEGQIFIATKKLIRLSAQNLVDCSSDHGNSGCWGGLMNNAFRYIRDNGGIETECSYGYHAEDTGCRYRMSRSSGARVTGVVNIPEGREELLAAAVATVGPVAAAVDASSFGFQFYSGGVYHDPDCSHRNLNHAVLVVGYGTDPSGGDYWLVKNSWGELWGEGGYMKLARNRDNHCGIASAASFPKVQATGGSAPCRAPEQQWHDHTTTRPHDSYRKRVSILTSPGWTN